MKKYFLSLFALASMVFASSCTSEEIISQSTGNEVAVTFTADLRYDVKSRAVGDDTNEIDELVFAVYDENEDLLPSLTKKVSDQEITLSEVKTDGTRTATITVTLVKGQTYSFVFWAQDKGYTAYSFDEETATVSINYGQAANNYSADAFFAKINAFTVTGTFEQTVTLKRPFAQVNFLTTPFDLEKAKAAGFEPSQSSIVVENAATSLNLLDGSVSGSTSATFSLANIVAATETTTIKNSSNSYITWDGTNVRFSSSPDAKYACNFRYLATAYFLPTEATGEAEITASMSVTGNTTKTVDLTAAGITAQRNYRTNIYGNLLTSNGQFHVVVNPDFDGDHSTEEEEPTTQVVGTIAEANKLFEEGATNVTVTEAPTTASTIYLPASNDDATVSFAFEEGSIPAAITIQYADGATQSPENVVVNGNAGDLVINAPNSTVALNGEYNSVTATTAANTLIVAKGSKITTLTLKQGNAEIYYGAVTGTVTKAKECTITWTVDSKEQLAQIATDVNAGMKFEKETIKLISDIDLENEEWTPIGLKGKRFMGTFDGQGHIISNFKITTADNGAQAALFGDVNKATIKNFIVDNAQVLYPAGYTDDFYGAAVVSQAYMVTLEKITVQNSIIQGNNKVAAILAHDADGASMIIEDCHVVDCTIETKNETDGGNAGGIVGSVQGSASTKSLKYCSVKNTKFNVVNSGDAGKRSNAQMVGTVIATAETVLTLENCVVEGNTFNQTGVVNYKTPYDGVFVGGARYEEAGKVVVNGKEYPIQPAYIGTTGYKSLTLALAASKDGDEILLTPGEHELSGSSVSAAQVTIKGENKETVIVRLSKSIYLSDKSITLSNLTYITPTGLTYNEQAFAFIHHAKAFDLNGCIVNGNLRLNVYSANISDCAFNITTSDGFDGYSLFYYGNDKSTVNVSKSTFVTAGKAIVIYSEGAKEYNLSVDGCTFTSSNSSTDKAAIQMHSEYGIYGTLTVNNFIAIGFASGNNGLWNEVNNNTKEVNYNFVKTSDGKKYITEGAVLDTETGIYEISSAKGLQAALPDLTDAGSGNCEVNITTENIDLTGVEWEPVKVDGYNGADIITINGNGAIIKGLTAPLFAGGFAGGSGIVIKDLTIDNSTIVSTNTIGSGAFIESVDSMDKIWLENCHVKNSSIQGGVGSRTGGLIGWTAGYNNENDGPVKTYVTIKDCSVIECNITCDGSVGGLYGHAGNNAWTYSTVENCTVKDCNLNSTDDGEWRVGVVVGTANVGELTISNITESGNTLTQTGKTAPEGQSNLYGRFVPGATGKLTIDGVDIEG